MKSKMYAEVGNSGNPNNMDLETYLRKRGISDDTIEYLESEKIDKEAIAIMDSSDLQKIFPKYGDRLAITEFCKRNVTAIKKRQSLYEKLKEKMCKSSDSDGDDDVKKQKKNKKFKYNSEKATRQIEIGWYNENDGKLIQVRAKKGGGTRRISVSKQIKKEGLIELAKSLFFPNDISPRGKLNDFTFDLLDSHENVIPEDITVNDMLETTKLKVLRFYLRTEKQNEIIPNSCVNSEEFSNNTESNVQDTTIQLETATQFYMTFVPETATGNDLENVLEFNTPLPSSSVESIEFTEQGKALPVYLTLHRGHIMDELINAFCVYDKSCGYLHIRMVLPNGHVENAEDVGGVYRDALSEFWETFYGTCTVGTKYKVPCLRHDFNEEKWRAVAKILYKGWKEEKYFPLKLAPAFLEYCILGDLHSKVEESFMNYIALQDADVLTKAVINYASVDESEIYDALESYDSKWSPAQNNISMLIHDIAHKELIQKPMFIIDCWQKELLNIMAISELTDIFLVMKPTPKNVLQQITTTVALEGDTLKVYGFLKKFLREADETILSAFLRFCTGADIVIQNKTIDVTFKVVDGLQRIPVAHTCGRVLELPTTYENFPTFRQEFTSILNSNVWVMDII